MRTQPERDIADTEAGVDSREFLLDGPQSLQRFDSRLPELFITGAERECQGIKNKVVLGNPIALGREAMNPQLARPLTARERRSSKKYIISRTMRLRFVPLAWLMPYSAIRRMRFAKANAQLN